MRRRFRSFGKVNLHLAVLGRREDGYHELETIFQTVELHDLLEVEIVAGAGIELEVVEGGISPGPENLICRAAEAFLQRWAPKSGARFRLSKRLPVGGGMGGGSSNAATTLLALRELVGRPGDREELQEVARALGADVPYFLVGGAALGRGRGDEVVPLRDLPESDLLLVFPSVQVSTAEVFAKLGKLTPRSTPSSIESFIEGAFEGSLEDLAGSNDLQEVVLREYPAVEAVYDALLAGGVTSARVTGSGGTLFAPAAVLAGRRELLNELPPGTRAVFTRSLSRESCERLRSAP